jgi:Xaa-Pro aminopeptidase
METHRYRARRAALAARRPGRAWLFHGHGVRYRNATTEYPYRQHGDLLYLAGIDEPDSALVVVSHAAGGHDEVLFVREHDPHTALWQGRNAGLASAAAASGIDDVRPFARLEADLPELFGRAVDVGYRLGVDARRDLAVTAALERSLAVRAQRAPEVGHLPAPYRRINAALPSIVDPRIDLAELRLRKDDGERDRMRRAAAISAAAHVELMRTARPTDSGRALAGRLEAAFAAGGASGTAYNSIVAIGDEALCLHATPTSRALGSSSLCLVDAAAELDAYASDLTRTFPAGGRFEGAAADLYGAVLEAQLAAVATVRPGSSVEAALEAALGSLRAALRGLGLPGPVERWFVHPIGHWVGLDVHDLGAYYVDGLPRPLEPGMAFTIEPGIYVEPAADVPEAMRGLAVRIEDTVLVTADGVEVLTAAAPKDPRAIEALRAEALAA